MTTATTVEAENVTFITRAYGQCITVRSGSEAMSNSRGQTTEPADPGFYPRFEGEQLTTDMLRRQAHAAGISNVEEAAQEAIDTIRNLEQYNVTATNGIWEQGHSPAEPKPTIDEMNERIAKATARRDIEELYAVQQDERETHNRSVVIRAAQHAIDGIAELEKGEEPE